MCQFTFTAGTWETTNIFFDINKKLVIVNPQ